MKHQALFSSKDKSKIIKVSSAAISLVNRNFTEGYVVPKQNLNSRVDATALAQILDTVLNRNWQVYF